MQAQQNPRQVIHPTIIHQGGLQWSLHGMVEPLTKAIGLRELGTPVERQVQWHNKWRYPGGDKCLSDVS